MQATTLSTKDQDAVVPAPDMPRGGDSDPEWRDTIFDSSCWGNIASGIILAGGLYPFVVVVAFGTVAALGSLLSGDRFPVSDIAGAIGASILSATMGGLVGMVWVSLFTVFTLPWAYFLVWSLNLRVSVTMLGAACGGLVGFVAVMPLMLLILFEGNPSGWAYVTTFALGPGLTTVMGQLGGAWGGMRTERNNRLYRNALLEAASGDRSNTAACPAAATGSATSSGSKSIFQFRIRHLLVLAAWISLLLSAIRLSGIRFEYVLPLLIGWLAYQTATILLGQRLFGWYARWRHVRNASRST